MKITFFGAAGEVTGSQHLLETANLRILLDCGMFQGHRVDAWHKNKSFRCEPTKLDGVILSHAHIDHCGNLPGLYRAGFRGPIYCTPATADVAAALLKDAVHIQEEDARYMQRHLSPGHPPVEPLYEEEHVRGVLKLIETIDYGTWEDLSPEFKLKFSEAGHILGSAICEMQMHDKGDMRRIVFSGDLGRRGLPLLRNPQLVDGCDVLITESTYGDRLHPPAEDLKNALHKILEDAANVGGRVIIPAFALGRTQAIVYFLNELAFEGRLPNIPVFVDSPLASRMTEIYRDNQEMLDADAWRTLQKDKDLFAFPGLTYVQSPQESAELNRRKGPFVVISASGMCESGRIRHHLKHGVADARNTILIIGFQAQHTLGRRLVEKRPEVKIFDRLLPLKAKVVTLNGLSAHADANDFKWWFDHMASEGGIGQAFIVHGEGAAAQATARLLHDASDEDPIIPELYQSFEV
jgi:metallo-beta-lactamase family protein